MYEMLGKLEFQPLPFFVLLLAKKRNSSGFYLIRQCLQDGGIVSPTLCTDSPTLGTVRRLMWQTVRRTVDGAVTRVVRRGGCQEASKVLTSIIK